MRALSEENVPSFIVCFLLSTAGVRVLCAPRGDVLPHSGLPLLLGASRERLQ